MDTWFVIVNCLLMACSIWCDVVMAIDLRNGRPGMAFLMFFLSCMCIGVICLINGG